MDERLKVHFFFSGRKADDSTKGFTFGACVALKEIVLTVGDTKVIL